MFIFIEKKELSTDILDNDSTITTTKSKRRKR